MWFTERNLAHQSSKPGTGERATVDWPSAVAIACCVAALMARRADLDVSIQSVLAMMALALIGWSFSEKWTVALVHTSAVVSSVSVVGLWFLA